MIDPKLAAHKAICYHSLWRALPDGSKHPRHYVRLNQREIAELAATGSFTLPDDVIPDSVRAWRKIQETSAEVVEGGLIAKDQVVLIGEHEGAEAHV